MTARYGTDILIGDQEVDEAMDRLKQGSDKPQFLLSEIYLGVDRSEDDVSVRASAEQFAQQIMQGVSFRSWRANSANRPPPPMAETSAGSLRASLAEELDRALVDLKPGQIAGPVRAEGGYYVLLLRDRREPAGTKSLRFLLPPADANAPLPLDRFLIPLPADADAMLKDRAMTLATNVANRLRTCADLPGLRASSRHGVSAARQHEPRI